MACFPELDLLSFASLHAFDLSSIANESLAFDPHELQYFHDFYSELEMVRSTADGVSDKDSRLDFDAQDERCPKELELIYAYARYHAQIHLSIFSLKMQSIPTFPTACKSIERGILRQSHVDQFDVSKIQKDLWGPIRKQDANIDLISNLHAQDLPFAKQTRVHADSDYSSFEMECLCQTPLYTVDAIGKMFLHPSDFDEEASLNVCNCLAFFAR